eukprot:CAMPEP_0171939044 /NCGR_PEP_ID=MMETSP0993-20121228/35975_1 /TAXON_ID=483369 /ORGANISM="non described non described, Strain CCMP2098" /LENGTH=102 /DNA_ID=CAMNT_0012580783 /DNA_START=407 /DNA_END=715 /DNA_ORIENTATION=-
MQPPNEVSQELPTLRFASAVLQPVWQLRGEVRRGGQYTQALNPSTPQAQHAARGRVRNRTRRNRHGLFCLLREAAAVSALSAAKEAVPARPFATVSPGRVGR